MLPAPSKKIGTHGHPQERYILKYRHNGMWIHLFAIEIQKKKIRSFQNLATSGLQLCENGSVKEDGFWQWGWGPWGGWGSQRCACSGRYFFSSGSFIAVIMNLTGSNQCVIHLLRKELLPALCSQNENKIRKAKIKRSTVLVIYT